MFSLLIILLSFFALSYAQRGGGLSAGVRFTPLTTPHTTFQTGGAFGDGAPIPMPRTWHTPSNTFTSGHIDHKNGYHTVVHESGRTVQHLHIKGQYGPATCLTAGGCGSLID